MSKKKKKRNRISMSQSDFNRELFYIVRLFMEQMKFKEMSISRNTIDSTEYFDITTIPDRINLNTNPYFKDMLDGLVLYMQYNKIYHLSVLCSSDELYVKIGNRCSAAPMAFNCLSSTALNKLAADFNTAVI